MRETIAFASTHHDPEGRLYQQTARMLPTLTDLYAHLTVVATSVTPPESRDLVRSAGAFVFDRGTALPETVHFLGHWRRKALELALREAPDATHIHFCDFDRILHWLETYPDELYEVLQAITHHDFTVLGRTPRAFASHPQVQRDTETIVNHVFGIASGLPWDVTAASRGVSRRAAEALVAGCHDETIGNDCSWVLFVQQQAGMTLGYVETEGLEFETLDRYSAEELARIGGAAGWLERTDADPRQWSQRMELGRIEVDSIITHMKTGV
jgi:hypothetical protein